jgi:acetylornithine deacetylase
MFCGHLDTSGSGDPERDGAGTGVVRPADRAQAFIRDGIVYGLGAYNMKGGVAAAAEAIIALKESGAHIAGDVVLGAVAGESEKAPVRGGLRSFIGPSYEGGGIGAQWLIQHSRRPDAVVIMEPSDCWVGNGQAGYYFLKLNLQGRSVYQGARGLGFDETSSIELAARVVQAIRAWEPVYREGHQLDTGMATIYPNVTAGAIEGGSLFKPSIWPASCSVYVDLRVPPHVDGHVALHELDHVVRTALGDEANRFSLEVFASNLPGAVTPVDHPLVQAALRARQTVMGAEQGSLPDVVLLPGDDGKLFTALGIPYVKCGPATAWTSGGQPAENPLGKEWVEIRQLVAASRIYVELALEMANRRRDEIPTWPPVRTTPAAFER